MDKNHDLSEEVRHENEELLKEVIKKAYKLGVEEIVLEEDLFQQYMDEELLKRKRIWVWSHIRWLQWNKINSCFGKICIRQEWKNSE